MFPSSDDCLKAVIVFRFFFLPLTKRRNGASGFMRLKAGGVPERHWHKAAEWAYMLKGLARITAIDQNGRTFQDDVGEGDLWYFPAGIPHSIQGIEGDEVATKINDQAVEPRIRDLLLHALTVSSGAID